MLSLQVWGKGLLPSKASTWDLALSHSLLWLLQPCLLALSSSLPGQWTEMAVPWAEEASPFFFLLLQHCSVFLEHSHNADTPNSEPSSADALTVMCMPTWLSSCRTATIIYFFNLPMQNMFILILLFGQFSS